MSATLQCKACGGLFEATRSDTQRCKRGAFYRGERVLVWEETHGMELPKSWVVHHLNGVKDDNRPENLLGLPRHEHHSHPKEALRPYEARIKALEELLAGP